ncbi:hypothetical protein [Niveispirillum cyanobacteriorum]|uniref:Uncharacterized protein n=1 Tax=Niveispirillum cyanobacteriorum TaxID=1612173 RepID=A0A2K9NL10_9PROT|nr:hypothetical protein [Niveispirillum cyanobacteriorum]AUN33759.1 hypothetical protein C0V82_25430 [Niveispirillum cyanobacteriorum]GGE82517.1 hypothetical protein GCM10011317_44670 [Niveispirillum cyanobacteriorum]
MTDIVPPDNGLASALPTVPVFKTDLFIPRYTLTGQGLWRLRSAPFSLSTGYWSPTMLVENLIGLIRNGDTWMSTAPLELESQELGIRHAAGHVLIYGMGMGWCAINCALMPAVTRVTVVELDPDILALHRELNLVAQIPEEAQAKLRVVQGDAYEYVPDAPVDLLMPDIWLPLMNDGRVEEVQRMQAKVGAARVYFWGQELELARHAVAAGREMDTDGIAATTVEFGLPLLGPDLSDYADKVRKASVHVRDRWLPGRVSPV